MNSLDTNILLYATNADCNEHLSSRRLVESALAEPSHWIIPDQVYFELYRLLRNPIVLARPLSAVEAAGVVDFYRHKSGWGRCAWDIRLFERVFPLLRDESPAGVSVFDLTLAATIADAGVTRFFTRNTRDFVKLEWFEVENPIESSSR